MPGHHILDFPFMLATTPITTVITLRSLLSYPMVTTDIVTVARANRFGAAIIGIA